MATHFEKKRHYTHKCVEESINYLRAAMTALSEFPEAREAPGKQGLFILGTSTSMVKRAADILEELEYLRQKISEMNGADKGLLPANTAEVEDEEDS